MSEGDATINRSESLGLPPAVPRIQADAWMKDGIRCVMIVAQGPHGAVAHCIYNDTVTSDWEVGSAVLAPSPDWHRRDNVEELVNPKAPSREDMLHMGFLDGEIGLAPLLVDVMIPPPEGADHVKPARRDATSTPNREGPELPQHVPYSAFGIPGTYQLGGHEYLATKTSHHRECRSAVGTPPPEVIETFGTNRNACLARVRAILREALASLPAPGDRAAFAILGAKHWNVRSHRFYAVPGRRGDRHRQAGVLYPALSTLMHDDGETVRAIDDGRPFETPFSVKVGFLAHPDTARGFDATKLRRLRALPRDMDSGYIAAAVEIAAQLPVDWLPRSADGWALATRQVEPMITWSRGAGTSLADLVHHLSGDWNRFEPKSTQPVTHPASESDTGRNVAPHMATLRRATDVIRRFQGTLVSQICQSLRISEYRKAERRIAGAILLRGKSLPAVHKMQMEWHEGLARQDAALPSTASNRWPAAFPDFLAPNGLLISCLVDEPTLKAEGSKGRDADNVAGLDHCVGGYGRKCYTGESVVASVRRYDGLTFERLSTVEFERYTPISSWKDAALERGLGLDIPYGDREDGPVLMVIQHYGRRNADPALECVEAVAALTRSIANGSHPIDLQALSPRDDTGFMDAYNWRIPGNLEQAFGAWKEYLPRTVANGGLASLVERIEAEARLLGFHPEDTLEQDAPDPDDEESRIAPGR